MSRFDRGVTWYTHGTITIDVAFPEDAVCCRYCPHLRADANGARHKCPLTNEIIIHLDRRGGLCPVEIDEGGKNGRE